MNLKNDINFLIMENATVIAIAILLIIACLFWMYYELMKIKSIVIEIAEKWNDIFDNFT